MLPFSSNLPSAPSQADRAEVFAAHAVQHRAISCWIAAGLVYGFCAASCTSCMQQTGSAHLHAAAEAALRDACGGG